MRELFDAAVSYAVPAFTILAMVAPLLLLLKYGYKMMVSDAGTPTQMPIELDKNGNRIPY